MSPTSPALSHVARDLLQPHEEAAALGEDFVETSAQVLKTIVTQTVQSLELERTVNPIKSLHLRELRRC
jgi:hypothetical protein